MTDRGTGKRRSRRRGKPIGATLIGQVAALKAEGVSNVGIKRALSLKSGTVQHVLSLPETQVEIAKRRELLKGLAIHKLSQILKPAWDMARDCVEQRDAKGFDATTRGLYAMEQIAASVSGETQKGKVEHSGAIDTPPAREELRELIAILLRRKPELPESSEDAP